MKAVFACVGLLCMAALPACEPLNLASRQLGLHSVLLTQADSRAILGAPQNLDAQGRNHPAQITCAEPSPDIAKAVDTAFGAGANVNLNINGAPPTPDQVVKIAAAISNSRAEAVAQLGERLASIQLLRDGLFHACEAYQNGALNELGYSLMLSRYGDTMVTLLGSELIAGEFGRSGAAISGSASAAADASDAQEDAAAAKQAAENVAAARNTLSDKIAAEDTARNDLAKATGDTVAAKKDALDAATVARDKAGRDLQIAEQVAAGSKAAAANSAASASGVGIGALKADISKERADKIADLVRDYVRTPNIHSIMTACIIALDDRWRGDSSFAQLCRQNMPTFVNALGLGFESAMTDLSEKKTDEDFRHLAGRINRLQAVLNRVKSTVAARSAVAPARKAVTPAPKAAAEPAKKP